MDKLPTLDQKIKQHNDITSGRYEYSACQLDVLFMILASIKAEDDPRKEYTVSVKDIEHITGRKWNYQQLRDSTAEMGSRMFEIQTPKSLKQIWLFSKVEYYDGTGTFGVKINEDARQYFFDLKSNFTILELKSVLSCSSKHAKRLYALACQWRRASSHTIPISELKEILGLKTEKGKEQYTEITALKRVVLDVAKKQINEHTDIEFDYELIKKNGRSYNTIKLYCGFKKPNFQLEIDFKEDLEYLKNHSTILASGIANPTAEILAKKHFKEFQIEKKKMLDEVQNGKKVIKDMPAYLVGIFQKKGYL